MPRTNFSVINAAGILVFLVLLLYLYTAMYDSTSLLLSAILLVPKVFFTEVNGLMPWLF